MKIQRVAALAIALAALGVAHAQDAARDAATACPRSTEVTHLHLLGLWRAEFEGLPRGATVLMEKHPEDEGRVSGMINRDGERSLLAGELHKGEFTMEESADGTHISGVWTGEVIEGSCGRVIRGTWQEEKDPPRPYPFVLRKQWKLSADLRARRCLHVAQSSYMSLAAPECRRATPHGMLGLANFEPHVPSFTPLLRSSRVAPDAGAIQCHPAATRKADSGLAHCTGARRGAGMLSTLARRPPVAGRCSAEALEAVLRGVMSQGYHFVTPTPLTHARVLARAPGRRARNLRDVFGWSMPFDAQLLAPGLLAAMKDGQVLYAQGDALHSAVRVSSLGQDALLHSAYPTVQDDAVFFGPDTYRFARFIEQAVDARVAQAPPGGEPGVRVLDIGCGSGAGGIVAARRLAYHGKQPVVTMNDINPQAVRLAAVNAAVAGVPVRLAPGDALAAVEGDFDLIISNPPYMADAGHRAYRDGGAGLGRELSVRIARESLARLTPNGQLLLYTGVAIVDGKDPFLAEVEPLLRAAGCQWSYSELDADVFGEELEAAPYDQAERIAAVGLVATHTGQA